jgi:hypothetical protein
MPLFFYELPKSIVPIAWLKWEKYDPARRWSKCLECFPGLDSFETYLRKIQWVFWIQTVATQLVA